MTKHEEALKKLKPGDRVRVMRKVPDEDEGWTGCWLDAMDDAIGQVYTVNEAGYYLAFEEREYSWPAHACMPEHSLSGYFQKGDHVRVREVSEDSQYGWGQVWDCKHMHVGHVGVIADVTANRSLGVNVDGFWYPEWVLDHAPAETEAAVAKAPEPEALKFETGAYVKVLRPHKTRPSETMHLVGTVVRIKKYRIDSSNLDVAEGIDHFSWCNDAFELVPAPTPAVATPDAVSADGKAIDFKVGDCGKTRGGGDYEVLEIGGKHVYIGIPQPIKARANDQHGPFTGFFAANGVFSTRTGKCDLMRPTHNVNDVAALASIQNTPRSTTSQESTMSNIKIETHTFVNGVKVQDLSQDTIVDIITGAERELAKMKSVNTQTRALKAKIAKLEGEIARLVELSDERYARDNPGEAAVEA